ncbi:MAG: hypothetical protein OXG82_15585 [Gammaproteobacteria bacterium]|nr:hypothetical protein [Gammaproteobacteria bacterium]
MTFDGSDLLRLYQFVLLAAALSLLIRELRHWVGIYRGMPSGLQNPAKRALFSALKGFCRDHPARLLVLATLFVVLIALTVAR